MRSIQTGHECVSGIWRANKGTNYLLGSDQATCNIQRGEFSVLSFVLLDAVLLPCHKGAQPKHAGT
jgi:hypothetical protein